MKLLINARGITINGSVLAYHKSEKVSGLRLDTIMSQTTDIKYGTFMTFKVSGCEKCFSYKQERVTVYNYDFQTKALQLNEMVNYLVLLYLTTQMI